VFIINLAIKITNNQIKACIIIVLPVLTFSSSQAAVKILKPHQRAYATAIRDKYKENCSIYDCTAVSIFLFSPPTVTFVFQKIPPASTANTVLRLKDASQTVV
jgi:hypothetical protein